MDTRGRASDRSRGEARERDDGRPAAAGRAAAVLLLALGGLGATPMGAGAQEAGPRWSCFRSWTVSTLEDTEPFTVRTSPWALRWNRVTPTHSDHDGLFAELFRVADDGEKTEDQVAAVNTDRRGHEGTVTVEETGRFWIHLESWSEETEWTLEACVPADSAAAGAPAGPGR